MLTLRPYQEECVQGLFDFFYEHRANPLASPIVCLPTGTGKSFVIAEFIRRLLSRSSRARVMVATHVAELVAQNHKELIELWPSAPAGIYSAGLKRRDVTTPITFCGIDSVAKRIDEFGHIDVLLVDECHLISDKDDTRYLKAIDGLRRRNPQLRVIGLSATPYRLGLGLLTEGKVFTHVSTDYCSFEKFNQLLDDGYMVPCVPKRTEFELDTNTVGTRGGEFIQAELQAAVDKEAITKRALAEAISHGRRRRHWLVFCTGVEHAEHVCGELNKLGFPALCVHSDVKELGAGITQRPGESIRDAHFRAFKEGLVAALVGVSVFGTGFNFPPVDFIVFLRPTKSAIIWVQFLGRGTRPVYAKGYDLSTKEGRLAAIAASTKQNCLVLDFGGNTRRLGPINDPVIPRKKGEKKSGMVPFKICPICDTYNHVRARFCVCCQEAFPERFNGSDTASEDELIRREKSGAEKKPRQEQTEIPQTFEVASVEFSRHISRDTSKPPSLRITFRCVGGMLFNQWLCLEHPPGYARKKAQESWLLLAIGSGLKDTSPPASVTEALELTPYLSAPRQINVIVRTQFSDVVSYTFGHDQQETLVTDSDLSALDIPF
jgi:DNA repair protein RadD